MLKFGCTLPNLANICLHSSTSEKFCAFTENEKVLISKVRKDLIGGPSIVFTRNVVVDGTHTGNSKVFFKLIVGVHASQLYPYSMCQHMPTGLCPDMILMQICKHSNPVRTILSKLWSWRFFKEWDFTAKLRTSTQHELRKRLIVSMQMGFVDIGTQCLPQGVVSVFTDFVKSPGLLQLRNAFHVEQEREVVEMRRQYIEETGYAVVEMSEYEC